MEQLVYITKYSLTSGIIECSMDVNDDGKYCYGKAPGFYFNTTFSKADFFLNKEEALNDCEKRRLKKITSLKKQISKLEKLSFTKP